MNKILARVYPPEHIFISDARFDPDPTKLTVTVDCRVPEDGGYTTRPVPYVTAENYVRILSQTCYVLAHHIISNKLIPVEVSTEDFLRAMEEFELYYRNLVMTFHERIKRGDKFVMELSLKDFREIKRLGDFIIFTFANKRTVISGEMSFVYVGR